MTNIRIKFKTTKERRKLVTRFNLEKLKCEEVRTELQAKIGGRFEALLGLEGDTEEMWCGGRDIIKEEAENTLGKKRKTKQSWMTEEVLEACDARREAKGPKTLTHRQKTLSYTDKNVERWKENAGKQR